MTMCETRPSPRYPDVHVQLHSRNPLAAVSAVRHALRRAGVERSEVRRFTEEAFAARGPARDVCCAWACFELDSP